MRFRLRPAASASLRPVFVEPVKLIRRTAGCSTNSSAIGPAAPGACVTMFSTPAGSPASAKISAPDQPADYRRPLRRLEDDRVAEHERRRDRACREDQRRVPGRDRADDADRPAQAHRERARHVGGDDLPDRRVRGAGRLPEEARDEVHLEHAEAEAAAGLAREQLDDLVLPRLSSTSAALRKTRCRSAGGVARPRGNAASAASIARRASSAPAGRDRRDDVARVRVAILERGTVRGVDPLAADELPVLLRRDHVGSLPRRRRRERYDARGSGVHLSRRCPS